MIIPIDEETRIVGTSRAWEIQRHRNYKGGKRWEPHKWFSTFRQALGEAVHAEIRTNPATTIADALEAVRAISRKYNDIVKASLPGVSA